MKYLFIYFLTFSLFSCDNAHKKIEFEVSSQQIYNEFQVNEVAALSKYKGKKIKVTGVLISFVNSMGDNYCYIGSKGDIIGEVYCRMSDEFSKNAGNYNKGQIITIEGIVEGKSIAGVVKMDNLEQDTNYPVMYFIVAFLFVVGIGLMIWGARKTFGNGLQRKFIRINPLKGKTYDQITKAVGLPNSYVLNKRTWASGGYSITLLFDDDNICLGVISEFKF